MKKKELIELYSSALQKNAELKTNIYAKIDHNIQWMSNKELMEYLHVSRRTT